MTTHTIQMNANPNLRNGRNVRPIRKTKSRQYGACLVATVTERVVAEKAAKFAADIAEEAALAPVVAAAEKALGMTLDEAKALHEAHCKAWYPAMFEEEAKIREAKRGQDRFYCLSEADREAAKAATEARGILNPYKQAVSAYLDGVTNLQSVRKAIAWHTEQNLKVGDQCVIAWSRTVNLAHKAVGSRDSNYYLKAGFTIEVRTDITVTP